MINPIEAAEFSGRLGKLQFEVQAIVGFARLCTGDVFEVVVKHGQQRWRARGKTQPDKSQKWDQQVVVMDMVWNMPVVIKVVEVHFLKSRSLNERQFDPAKFALAQPQLVTMNLNSMGSMRMKMVVTWLPLLSSQPLHPIQLNSAVNPSNRPPIATANPWQSGANKNEANKLASSSIAADATKLAPKKTAAAAEQQHAKDSEKLSSNFAEDNKKGGPTDEEGGDPSSPVKVCLREKKRQNREQRLKTSTSMAFSEASRFEKEQWRCSSTTLLDALYKNLSKSIPTIDDLSALQSSKSFCSNPRQSEFGAPQHRSFGSEHGVVPLDSQQPKTRRIFSFVTRSGSSSSSKKNNINNTNNSSQFGADWEDKKKRTKHSEWRKSASIGQLATSSRGSSSNGSPKHFENPVAESTVTKTENGHAAENTAAALLKRNKLSSLKKKGKLIDSKGSDYSNFAPSVQSASSSSSFQQTTTPMEQHQNNSNNPQDCGKLENALKTVEELLATIDAIRAHLTKLRPNEFRELVAFEAAMLNWEAFLKLNRSEFICRLDEILVATKNNHYSFGSTAASALRYCHRGPANNRCSLFHMPQSQSGRPQPAQEHSPSTVSGGGDDSDEQQHPSNNQNQQHLAIAAGWDQFSENDSGIDSLRQHSPYNNANGSSSKKSSSAAVAGGGRLLSTTSKGVSGIVDGSGSEQRQRNQKQQGKDRRKSIGAILANLDDSNTPLIRQRRKYSPSGSPEIDNCLNFHLRSACNALQMLCDVQQSPFEYTLTKMLCRIEVVETIALEAMMGLAQDILMAHCPSSLNPQILLQLGLEFPLQQIWLSAGNNNQLQQQNELFLLIPVEKLRVHLRSHCDRIVRSRYPKLVETVLDSLLTLLCENAVPNQLTSPYVSLFQFVGLFRGKQFTAFIENLSHEAWISATLLSGQQQAVKEVMERLRHVPVVPPLDSLRHIGLVLVTQSQHSSVIGPIEKYLKKASRQLSLDLTTCFVCLLEHEDELSRCGACRALAILAHPNSLYCLEFLSQSDCSPRVRTEASNSVARIKRARGCNLQQEFAII